MRRAARTDANHREIIDALRAAGCTVRDTSSLGSGFPDAIARHGDRIMMLEIKDGGKSPSRRKLTSHEAEFHATWGRHVAVVTSAEEALAVMGVRLG